MGRSKKINSENDAGPTLQEDAALGAMAAGLGNDCMADAELDLPAEQAGKKPNSKVIRYSKRLFLGNEITKKISSYYNKYSENMYLQTEDAETIGAFFYKPRTITTDTQYYIVCHGKGCDRYQAGLFGNLAKVVDLHNVCLIMPDYRGFGDSTGEYTIEGVNYDILAAYRYLVDAYGAKSIGIVGHSLGTAVALEYGKFAKLHRPECLPSRIVCMAPFTSTVDICKDFKVYLLLSFLIPNLEAKIRKEFNYDSISNSSHVKDRLHIIHGAGDDIISHEHGRRIASAAGCPITVTDHTHLTIFNDIGVWNIVFALEKK